MSGGRAYTNLKTWKEIKPYPICGLDEEHTFSNSWNDANSVWEARHIHFSDAAVANIWQYDEENMSFSVDCHPYDYDPLNNLLMKYKQEPNQFFVMCSLFQNHQESDLQRGQSLLPKRNVYDSRKTLVLDMDETLVHCSYQQEQKVPCDWKITLENGRSVTDVFCWVRPNLEQFLRAAAKMYEIVVFTAGQEVYANKVLDLIDPTGYIEHRLFRQHCTQVHGNFVKDLTLLGRELTQTVIIDNSPISFAFHPLNGILCNDWLGNPKDYELLQLIPILQLLNSSMDVRAKLWEISYVGHFLFDLCEALSENEESWRIRAEGSGCLNEVINS